MRSALISLFPGVIGSLLFIQCGGTDGPPLDSVAPGYGGAFQVEDTGPVHATDCAADDDLELYIIDDFELGAATGAFTNNEVCEDCRELEGQRLIECQDLCIASQYPTDYDKPLPSEIIPGGRCGSRYALHLTSQSFHDWGGLVGFPFAPAFDARDYDGVAFWGRVAWGTRSTLRATVLDPETDSTFVDPDSGESLCDGESDLDEFDEACDAFGGYAYMTGDWKFYRIPFAEMRQRGYGHVAPFIDLGAARQVSVEYGTGAWDFWVDDLAFYKKAEVSP